MAHYCEATHYCEELSDSEGVGCIHGGICSHYDHPATIKHHAHWYCEVHYQALANDGVLYLNPDVTEAKRRI
jgi:hypothetical protein